MKKITLPLLVLAIISCNNHEKGAEDGGPCVFTDELTPITVARIIQTSDSLWNVDFFWGDSAHGGVDTSRHFNYFDVNHNFLKAADISAKKIKIGSPAEYVLSRTTHGSCDWQKEIRFGN
jgi:hypothetical protein